MLVFGLQIWIKDWICLPILPPVGFHPFVEFVDHYCGNELVASALGSSLCPFITAAANRECDKTIHCVKKMKRTLRSIKYERIKSHWPRSNTYITALVMMLYYYITCTLTSLTRETVDVL